MAIHSGQTHNFSIRSFFQDERTRNLLWQFIFFVAIVFILFRSLKNVVDAMAVRGMVPSFKFLSFSSGITVGETLIQFNSRSSNLRALAVGLLNTVSISILVMLFSILFGLLLVLCRISSNWIVSHLARAYIEIIRNIPLLILLLFWYRAFFLQMPTIRNAIMLHKIVSGSGEATAFMILSNRGLYLAWPMLTDSFRIYRFVLIAAIIIAIAVYLMSRLHYQKTGRKTPGFLWAIFSFIAVSAAGLLYMRGNEPFAIQIPVIGKFNARGGLYVSSEWFSLFSGLVLYTSAYVAEALRAGIQGVPKGQIEAARALGFSHLRALRLVVIPQAKIVAIPPLTSIFLGVAKNTSLGVAIGFPDLFSITGTIINQTGRALEMILLVMAIYLAMSGITSLFMNWYNQKVQLIER